MGNTGFYQGYEAVFLFPNPGNIQDKFYKALIDDQCYHQPIVPGPPL
jgi:hypothetical protein